MNWYSYYRYHVPGTKYLVQYVTILLLVRSDCSDLVSYHTHMMMLLLLLYSCTAIGPNTILYLIWYEVLRISHRGWRFCTVNLLLKDRKRYYFVVLPRTYDAVFTFYPWEAFPRCAVGRLEGPSRRFWKKSLVIFSLLWSCAPRRCTRIIYCSI